MNKVILFFILISLFILIISFFYILTRVLYKYFKTPSSIWKVRYNYISKYNLQTMNYGYNELDYIPTEKDLKDVDFFSKKLYWKVSNLEQINLSRNETILEVGCGRGGGIYFLAEKFKEYNFIGLDYSEGAIDSAKKKFILPNLKFIKGDATNLPFKDNSIGTIINIESSHCYPNFSKFIEESKRVLRTNGHFLYADFKRDCLHGIQKEFEVVKVENISPNVIDSMDRMIPVRKYQINQIMLSSNIFDKIIIRSFSDEFTGNKNSYIYKSLTSGKEKYIYIKAIKK